MRRQLRRAASSGRLPGGRGVCYFFPRDGGQADRVARLILPPTTSAFRSTCAPAGCLACCRLGCRDHAGAGATGGVNFYPGRKAQSGPPPSPVLHHGAVRAQTSRRCLCSAITAASRSDCPAPTPAPRRSFSVAGGCRCPFPMVMPMPSVVQLKRTRPPKAVIRAAITRLSSPPADHNIPGLPSLTSEENSASRTRVRRSAA
jgi:hypothetical protein